MTLEHFLIPYAKINSKWIKDLHIRLETIKLLEENIGRTLNDINQSKILYYPGPRVMEIKTKVDKWDLIKLKSFCTAKETMNKVETQPSEYENSKWKNWQRINLQNIQATHASKYQDNKQPNKKVGKIPKQISRHLSKEDIQMANKCMKRCSTVLIIK